MISWDEQVHRWSRSPFHFVLEALFHMREEEWQPWTPGTARPVELPRGPDLWQGRLLQDVAKAKRGELGRRFTIRAGHGVGKALGTDEPVLTPHGWVRIGDVSVGELVATVDGSFTPVLGVYPQGERDLYRVTLNDGCSVVVDGDHLWETTTRSERKHGKPGRVRTTHEIAASLTFPNGAREGLNHCLPRLAAVQHPKAAVPVDPYVLGVWLGDGSLDGRITTNALDEDIVAACGHRTVSVRGGSVQFTPPGLNLALKVLGLDGCRSWEKFIPRVYLHGSVSQRVALLQGLLDTDGTVGSNNAVTFDTASEALADGVAELVRSLGGVARRGGRQGRLNGDNKRWSHRVYVSLPDDVAPFRCARKANAYRPAVHRNRDRTLSRFIQSVEPVGRGEAVCIAVAHPSHLYVTRDHIVTHNTTTEAWLILWFVLFHRDLKVPVTANSQDQLRDVLWAELAKWHRRLPDFLREMVEVSTERVTVKADPEGSFAVARTARPERPEALQGFHAHTLAFFADEASGIADIIFEVAGGTLSSDDVWFFQFGNPTRPEGYFYRSHTVNRDRYNCYKVSCHDAVRVSPSYAAEMAHEYGEDSNVYRIRVLGEFPLEEDDSVISLGLVEAAVGREIVPPDDAAVVWGVDVARFGDDASALAKRLGPVLMEPVREWRKLDLMQTAGVIAKEYSETPIEKRPSAINIDVIGMGGGVVDRLRELGLPVRGINVGEAAAVDPARYMRLRDELWFAARDWFDGKAVSIPRDDMLTMELVAPKYRIESSGKLKVESKDDMKKRGVKSPNKADAFCLTFAGGDFAKHIAARQVVATSYDPFTVGQADFERTVRQAQAGVDWSPF